MELPYLKPDAFKVDISTCDVILNASVTTVESMDIDTTNEYNGDFWY